MHGEGQVGAGVGEPIREQKEAFGSRGVWGRLENRHQAMPLRRINVTGPGVSNLSCASTPGLPPVLSSDHQRRQGHGLCLAPGYCDSHVCSPARGHLLVLLRPVVRQGWSMHQNSISTQMQGMSCSTGAPSISTYALSLTRAWPLHLFLACAGAWP